MGWIGSIIVGLIAGWIAEQIMHRDEGLLTNLIVGLIGGLIGGGIMELLGFSKDGGWIYSILVAVLGACLLLWIVGLVRGRSSAKQ